MAFGQRHNFPEWLPETIPAKKKRKATVTTVTTLGDTGQMKGPCWKKKERTRHKKQNRLQNKAIKWRESLHIVSQRSLKIHHASLSFRCFIFLPFWGFRNPLLGLQILANRPFPENHAKLISHGNQSEKRIWEKKKWRKWQVTKESKKLEFGAGEKPLETTKRAHKDDVTSVATGSEQKGGNFEEDHEFGPLSFF